jgi:hypothetical protein
MYIDVMLEIKKAEYLEIHESKEIFKKMIVTNACSTSGINDGLLEAYYINL